MNPYDCPQTKCCFTNRHKRVETDRFHAFSYEELTKREHANLDIFWLKEDSLEDISDLPTPDVLATEITQNLQTALELFQNIQTELGRNT